MHAVRIRSVIFVFTALLISLPVLALISSWLEWNAVSAQVLSELSQTVLPDYLLTSLLLCAGVAVGVTVLGLSAAAAVTLFRFPGYRFFEWALLLPMAMPAYVVAYAYTDFFSSAARFKISYAPHGPWRAAFSQKLGAWGVPFLCSHSPSTLMFICWPELH